MVRFDFRRAATIASVTSVLCLLVYATAQQIGRQSANDPQVQMAEDAAAALRAGLVPAPRTSAHVEIERSLAPWLAVFDARVNPLETTGTLHGAVPELPAGVLSGLAPDEEERVTWQPEPGVRQATVVIRAGDKGFVVAGRSLREIERRTDAAGQLAFAAWAVLAAIAAGASIRIS